MQLRKGENGSALIIVLVMVATIAISGYMVMQRSASLSQSQAQRLVAASADNVAQSIGAILSKPSVCMYGFDGGGSEPGLRFYSTSGSPSNFDLSLASSVNGQAISVPGIYQNSGGARADFAAGLEIPNDGMSLNRIYISNPTQDIVDPTVYIAKIYADLRPTTDTTISLSPREVTTLKFKISAGVLTSCEQFVANNNRSICEGMGCTYTTTTSGAGSCFCSLQATTCSPGTYIESVTNGVPQCSQSPILRSCASVPNGYLVALDSSGREVCGQVSPCPVGSSRIGLGGAAVPSGCRCDNAGDTYSNGTCGVATAPTATPSATATPTATATPNPNACSLALTPSTRVAAYDSYGCGSSQPSDHGLAGWCPSSPAGAQSDVGACMVGTSYRFTTEHECEVTYYDCAGPAVLVGTPTPTPTPAPMCSQYGARCVGGTAVGSGLIIGTASPGFYKNDCFNNLGGNCHAVMTHFNPMNGNYGHTVWCYRNATGTEGTDGETPGYTGGPDEYDQFSAEMAPGFCPAAAGPTPTPTPIVAASCNSSSGFYEGSAAGGGMQNFACPSGNCYFAQSGVVSYHSCDIPPCPVAPVPDSEASLQSQVRSSITASGLNPNNYDLFSASGSGSCPAPGCDNYFPDSLMTVWACPK